MSTYINLGDGRIQLPFGILAGVTDIRLYESGELRSVKLSEKNVILTHAGELFPACTETPRRKNKPSVEFHKDGIVRAAALEKQQEVATPIGPLPAELVTFYETGELHRVFPTDGALSGYWSEEDERSFNILLSFDLGFTAFTAMLSCISFYRSGDIKSITLYPGETISADTPSGRIQVRQGFSLYESGALRSLEPDCPVVIMTPIGAVTAYDPMRSGITADNGSVVFSEDGRLLSISTVSNRIAVQTENGHLFWHEPAAAPHPCADDQKFYKALKITFDYANETAAIGSSSGRVYALDNTYFTISDFSDGELGCSPQKCSSCSLCTGH